MPTAHRGLTIPEHYTPVLGILDTEIAIKLVKDTFERELAASLSLTRVSAPLMVRPETGLNDDLNGVERPVEFDIPAIQSDVQIVHSLAKWKRLALRRYHFAPGTGLYTDMNAIRRDEALDNLHSIYVDQWDWEKVIEKEDRTLETLQSAVRSIVDVCHRTQEALRAAYPALKGAIHPTVTFITAQELLDRYPDLSAKERENTFCREHGTVFIMQIGGKLSNGEPHDGRAPDYDDWSLNGDLLVWSPVIGQAVELSSMGIRVDEETLYRQLALAGCEERASLPFHEALLNSELPLTMGGGIGQSRMCMVMLEKAHIGEVQSAVWSDEMALACEQNGIALL